MKQNEIDIDVGEYGYVVLDSVTKSDIGRNVTWMFIQKHHELITKT